MKSTIILSAILIATLFSNMAFSQQIDETVKTIKSPKFVIGLKTGAGLTDISSTIGTNNVFSSYGFGGNLIPNNSTGLFARYYLGEHFAIETGLNIQFYKRQNPYGYRHTVGDANGFHTTYYPITSVRYNNFELPIEFQYFLGKRKAKLRPYFGLGVGYTRDRYVKNLMYTRKDGVYVDETYIEVDNDIFLSFTQGLTYQITDKLQINQSFRLKLGTISATHFNFGLGYTIGK